MKTIARRRTAMACLLAAAVAMCGCSEDEATVAVPDADSVTPTVVDICSARPSSPQATASRLESATGHRIIVFIASP